ncbi:hypothetical protein Tco_0613427 [Tanacetum coccineum]
MVARSLIELELWNWDDFDLKVDGVEGVPAGVGGDGSNFLKMVDRIPKSDKVEYDNVVCGVKEVYLYRLKESNKVSVGDHVVCDPKKSIIINASSKVYVVFVDDHVVNDPNKFIKHATKGKFTNSKNVIIDATPKMLF